MTSRLRAAIPLAGILLLGAALRFQALDFGLAYPHARPDEGTAVGHAVAILAGDPNPHFFHWPSLTLYLFASALALAKAAGATFNDPGRIVFARAIVAAAGTLTVLPAAAAARRLAGRQAGLAAALFVAVAPLHVRESHFALTDTLMTFFVMASLAV